MHAWTLIAFAPAAFAMSLTPGPSNLLAFVNGAQAGLGAAAKGVLGRLAAYAMLICAVALGLGALLAASAAAFAVVKWAGVGWLLYLGWRMWRAPVEGAMADAREAAALSGSGGALMRREFLTGISNPKALALFTAFLPQFVEPGQGAFAVQLLQLGAVFLCTEMAAASVWAGAGALVGARAMTRRRRRWLNRGAAAVLVGAAAWLARSERTA